MIDLACPKCGRAGSIPREKINQRLVCKKCLVVFHMNTAGRTLLGEPQADTSKTDSHPHEGSHMPSFEGLGGLKDNLPTVSGKSLLLGVAAIVVGGGLFMFMTKPPESLAERAKITAERFAQDDLAYLKEIASSDSIDDVVRWFDAVHPQFVKNRAQWKSRDANVQVMIIGEDRRQRRGEAQAFIYPAQGSSHSASIAKAADAATSSGEAPPPPVDLKLHWILESGRWRLDGKQTLEAANRST